MSLPLIAIIAVAGLAGAGAAYKAGGDAANARHAAAVAEKNVTIATLNSEVAAERARKDTVIKEIVTEVQERVIEKPVPGKTIVLRPECDLPEELRARLNQIR